MTPLTRKFMMLAGWKDEFIDHERKEWIKHVSMHLQKGSIDPPDIVRRAIGPGTNEKAYWAMVGIFFDRKMKQGGFYSMRHPFDVAFRALFRDAYEVSPIGSSTALIHDNLEEALKGINLGGRTDPLIAAYAMAYVLADTVGRDETFGFHLESSASFTIPGDAPRFGGAYRLTDFNNIVAGDIAKRIQNDQNFFTVEKKRGTKAKDDEQVIYLTEDGRKNMIRRINRREANWKINSDRVRMAYNLIASRYEGFLTHINGEDPGLAEVVRPYITPFIDASKARAESVSKAQVHDLEGRVNGHFDHAREVVSNPSMEEPASWDSIADMEGKKPAMWASKVSLPGLTINKSFYGDYLASIFRTIGELPESVIRGQDQSYIEPAVTKLMDLAENASLMINEDFANVTGINRKVRLAMKYSTYLIKELKNKGAPEATVTKVFLAADYAQTRLGENLRESHDYFRERSYNETAFEGTAHLFLMLQERLARYEKNLRAAYKTPWTTRFGAATFGL